MQSYAFSEGSLSAIGTENGKQNMSYRSCSGLKGVEILNEMDAIVEEIIAVLYDKLHSDPVTPSMYDVITAPDVTGVIAHEAFGHGVEMDMFVKTAHSPKSISASLLPPSSPPCTTEQSAHSRSAVIFLMMRNARHRHHGHRPRYTRYRHQRSRKRTPPWHHADRKRKTRELRAQSLLPYDQHLLHRRHRQTR